MKPPKYECKSCGYKFVPKTDKIPKNCPYCNAPGIGPADNAQDIINDALNTLG